MAQPVPTSVPRKLSAGTAWTWRRTYSTVPTGATVKFHFLGASSFTLTTTEDLGTWLVDANDLATTPLVPGVYRWEARATVTGKSWIVERGVLHVLANASAFDGVDQRSFNEQMLAALECRLNNTTLEGSADIESYKIGDRELTLMGRRELLRWYHIFHMRVTMERNGGRLPPVEVRFAGA